VSREDKDVEVTQMIGDKQGWRGRQSALHFNSYGEENKHAPRPRANHAGLQIRGKRGPHEPEGPDHERNNA
jgi:hypothetical protein